MTTYTTVANGDIDQDSPVTQPLMVSLRDNPIAMAEMATDAPVLASGWHPYDMVAVGDGADGVIYDYSVDGTVASVETPNFSDGWEYRLVFLDISPSSGTPDLEIEMYRETGAAYDTASSIFTTSGAVSNTYTGYLDFFLPRVSRNSHMAQPSTFVEGAGGGTYFTTAATSHGFVADKIGKARVSWSSGNIDGGKIHLLRRRDTLTA